MISLMETAEVEPIRNLLIPENRLLVLPSAVQLIVWAFEAKRLAVEPLFVFSVNSQMKLFIEVIAVVSERRRSGPQKKKQRN